jgi:hypothetical protein
MMKRANKNHLNNTGGSIPLNTRYQSATYPSTRYRFVSFHTIGIDTVFSTGFPSSVAGIMV